MFELQKLVHGWVEFLRADSLLIIGEQAIDFLNLLIHFLRFSDSFHDFYQACELDATVFSAVMLFDQLLDFVIWQVNIKASEQVFKLTCRNGTIAIFIKEFKGLPILLQGSITGNIFIRLV